jgi:hypothetical protein
MSLNLVFCTIASKVATHLLYFVFEEELSNIPSLAFRAAEAQTLRTPLE